MTIQSDDPTLQTTATASLSKQLGIVVHLPHANDVLTPGTDVAVEGMATGIPGDPHGGDPIFVDTVTVNLAGASIDAELTAVLHQPVPTVRFEATLTVPDVGGDQQLRVDAFGENHHNDVAVPVIIQTPVTPPPPPWATSSLEAVGALPATARLTAIAKPVGCELWWIGVDGAVNGVWTEPGTAWQNYQLAGPGSAAPGGGISAVSQGEDAMEVWWVAPDGSIQGAYHAPDWNPYALTGPGTASLTGGIAGIYKGNGQQEVWWIAPDGSVQAAYYDGGWAPYELAPAGSASTNGSIAAVAKGGGDAMEVWWIAPDGSIQAAYNDGGWAPYALTGPGAAATTGGITAVFKGGDSMEVWWVAPDGSIAASYHETSWQPYTLAGSGSASATCRITSAYGGAEATKVMRVWWVDPAGKTYQAFYDSEWAVTPIGVGANPSGATVGVLFNPDTPAGLWALPDGSLVDAHPPEITLSAHVSGGRGLRGTVWLTLREDGSTRWHGDVTNGEIYGYNYALSVFAETGSSADLGAAHHGSVAGWGEPGSSNDIWEEWHDPNLMLAGDLDAYRFSSLSIKLEHSVDLVDYVEAALDAIYEAAVGTALAQYGLVIVIGIEVGSYLATGSLVPGAIIAGGIPWLTGPAGLYVRVLVTATNSDGRQLTDEEYAWANDNVFRGCLPPIDAFRVTNYIGAGGRPFTFPALGGPTLVNVGDAIYSDIHVNQGADQGEQTIVHELVHVCQIAHSLDVAFTAKAIVTQLKNEADGRNDVAYQYGAAGFDYTEINFEAQAQVVEDWFLGDAQIPPATNPNDTNHTHVRMDAQSPYYRYITDNLRTGQFG